MTDDIFNKKNCFAEWAHVKSELIVGDYNKCPDPIVSIIIPCYNRPDYFKLSLLSALNQDCNFSYEIIVVDNNAQDVTFQNQVVVEECYSGNVFYYRNDQNIGAAGNWNRGIELARASYITFCHDDDLLLPNCLSLLMGIQRETGNKCILSAYNRIDKDGNYTFFKDALRRKKHISFLIEKPYYNYSLYDMFLSSKACNGVGCLYYRKYLLELGGFNNDFFPSFDYALHCSYTYYYGCVYNPLPTMSYRLAFGESLNCYSEFNKAGYYFRKCMMKKIHLPKFILSYISCALYNVYEIFDRNFFEKRIEPLKPSLKDLFIVRISTFFSQRIKPYKISLKF